MKKVLLATRPLIPPWDEASKNFAYFLGKSITRHALTLLGGVKKPLLELPSSVTLYPLFKKSHFGIREKLQLFFFLWRNRAQFDITHYLFTPTKQNTSLLKKLLLPTSGKTIQTVATLRDDLYSEKELQSLLFADKLVVYTDRSRQKLENLGFTNVKRIYPGIDLSLYQKKEKSSDFLKQLNLEQDHFIVIYPGEYVRLGATDYLTDFCIRYFTENKDTRVRFVFASRIKNAADAKKKKELEQKLALAGVEQYVRFTNNVPDMSTLYNIADTVVFPVINLSGKFDVPLVIVEAYACQKPVILSDLEAFAEFSDPHFCVTIPTGSQEALAEKITWLDQNPSEAAALGTNARAFVEEHFDLKHTAEEYSKLYDAL
jgi:glycosyltransferase involved in cell wall biosynthesis